MREKGRTWNGGSGHVCFGVFGKGGDKEPAEGEEVGENKRLKDA